MPRKKKQLNENIDESKNELIVSDNSLNVDKSLNIKKPKVKKKIVKKEISSIEKKKK